MGFSERRVNKLTKSTGISIGEMGIGDTVAAL